MPMILHFGGGSASSGRGYFMAALVFSIVCIPCFWVCVASTKEIIGGGAKIDGTAKESTLGNLAKSFKYTFQDRNAVSLVMAMFMFLTGIFGRLGIMAYYFIYVLGNPALIAGFAPLAIAIHIMYFGNREELRVHHFVSESNESISDPARK